MGASLFKPECAKHIASQTRALAVSCQEFENITGMAILTFFFFIFVAIRVFIYSKKPKQERVSWKHWIEFPIYAIVTIVLWVSVLTTGDWMTGNKWEQVHAELDGLIDSGLSKPEAIRYMQQDDLISAMSKPRVVYKNKRAFRPSISF